MTDYQVTELAHRTCWKYKVGSNPQDRTEGETYTFNKSTMLEFARILLLMAKEND